MRVWQKGTWDLFETLQLFATVPTTKPLHGQVESQCSFSISINNSFLIPYCQSYMNSVELKLKTHVIYLMEAIKKGKKFTWNVWNLKRPYPTCPVWLLNSKVELHVLLIFFRSATIHLHIALKLVINRLIKTKCFKLFQCPTLP